MGEKKSLCIVASFNIGDEKQTREDIAKTGTTYGMMWDIEDLKREYIWDEMFHILNKGIVEHLLKTHPDLPKEHIPLGLLPMAERQKRMKKLKRDEEESFKKVSLCDKGNDGEEGD